MPSAVTITETKHTLYTVPTKEDVGKGGPITATEVDAWQIDNGLLQVKVIKRGGRIISVQKGGKDYLWQNKAGAAFFGNGTNNFALHKGIIVHGGIFLAVAAPEHGLYFDTEWDMEQKPGDGNEVSMVFSVRDTKEEREKLGGLSVGQFCDDGKPEAMSKYPVSDALYKFTVTLRKHEAFVRLRACIINDKWEKLRAEMWMPQTYPIEEASQIISHQKKRRVKDEWSFNELIDKKYDYVELPEPYPENPNGWKPKVITLPAYSKDEHADLNKPFEWPTPIGGILYDYPYREGPYHALSFGDGRGAAYVSPSNAEHPHNTKVWSWGNRKINTNGDRPASEYYEPWDSGFNPAFFEPYYYSKGTHHWDAKFVPIEDGLEKEKSQEQLRETVDKKIAPIVEKD